MPRLARIFLLSSLLCALGFHARASDRSALPLLSDGLDLSMAKAGPFKAGPDSIEIAFFDFDDSLGQADPQGWSEVDRTLLGAGPRFRVEDFAGLGGGDFGLLTAPGGTKALWLGVRPGEPGFEQIVNAPGYGNNWGQCVESHEFNLEPWSDANLFFDINWNTEANYDYVFVQYLDGDGEWQTWEAFSGFGSESRSYTIPSSALGLSSRFRICFQSDNTVSDEDVGFNSDGAVVLDNLFVSTWSFGIGVDFESDPVGASTDLGGYWDATYVDGFGDFTGLVDGDGVVQEDPGGFNDSNFWGFFDGSPDDYACGGFPGQEVVPYGEADGVAAANFWNQIASPWIDLTGLDLATLDALLLSHDIYGDMRYEEHVFLDYRVNAMVDGTPTGWLDPTAFIYYLQPKLWDRWQVDIAESIPPDANQIRVAIDVRDWAPIFGAGVCHSHGPLIDNIRLVAVPPPAEWSDVASPPLDDPNQSTGVAWGDYDGDGDPDLYVSNADANNHLFENQDGSFVDVTAGPLVGGVFGLAGVWGDSDNDGDLDLYISNGGANALLRNDGDGNFTDVTTPPLNDIGSGLGVSWVDYDLDGWLDLYISNVNANNLLLRNMSGNQFEDPASGAIDDPLPTSGIAWADYDDDLEPDVYIARTTGSNALLRNDDQGLFIDATVPPLDDAQVGRGVAWADYDNDGDLDLYLGNTGSNKLFRNDGGGAFSDVTVPPLDDPSNSRSVAWADYDNDGDVDLYIANTDLQANKLLRNDGAGVFVDVTTGPLGNAQSAAGAAWADFDGDGDLDLYIANQNGPNALICNDAAGDNQWLQFELEGSFSNRSAIGARVKLFAAGQMQVREIAGGSGYLSQNSLLVEFGLGSTTVADSVEVAWPSGRTSTLTDVAANQRISIVEPQDKWVDISALSGAPFTGAGGYGSWGDADGDGDDDLYVAQLGAAPNFLFENVGGGVLVDRSYAPLGGNGNSQAASWADWDNDGDLDLVVTNVFSSNEIFINEGLGGIGPSSFVVAPPSALDTAGDSWGPAWGDFDDDGWLDIYYAAILADNLLLRNELGSFVEVAAPPHVTAWSVSANASWADYDFDGDVDLFVLASPANGLLRNDGDGNFTDITDPTTAGPGEGIPSAAQWIDFDGDLDLDLFISVDGAANRMLRNEGTPGFVTVSIPAIQSTTGGDVEWVDYDNDGDLDVFLEESGNKYKLLRNDGQYSFVDVTPPDLVGVNINSACWSDVDLDGDLDLSVGSNNPTGRTYLLRNDRPGHNHWLQVDLIGTASNRSAVGAQIRAFAGDEAWLRELGGSDSIGHSSRIAHFGLGSHDSVDSLLVHWPSGAVDKLRNKPADQRLTIVEGQVVAVGGAAPKQVTTLLGNAPNPFNPRTEIHFALRQPGRVDLVVYDLAGRRVRRLLAESRPAGRQSVTWDARDDGGQRVSSGTYFARLTAGGAISTQKLSLVK